MHERNVLHGRRHAGRGVHCGQRVPVMEEGLTEPTTRMKTNSSTNKPVLVAAALAALFLPAVAVSGCELAVDFDRTLIEGPEGGGTDATSGGDTGTDSGADSSGNVDSGVDAGVDAKADAKADTGADTGVDSGGMDAGCT